MEGVSVIIKKDEKYLMMQQPETKPFALKWVPISGAVEEGETLKEAIIREVKEETGLEIEIIDKVVVLPADYNAERVHVFTANWKDGEVNASQREIRDFGWFTYEEILKLDLMGSSREFFERHFKLF